MKIAMIYPAHVSVIEKTAALFGQLDVIMIPAPGDDGAHSKMESNKARLLKEGPELGFETTWIPLDGANWSQYDVVIDTWEARNWEPSWREMSWELDVPRIVKVSWFTPDTIPLEPRDREMFARSVVSTDSIVAADLWQRAGVDAHFIPWYPGDWYFEQEWTGQDNRALFVLAGAYKWRGGPESQPRLRDWLKLTASVPGFHLDAADRYRSSLELAREMAAFRCYVNLDCDASSRHLSLSFTEALAIGIPCLVVGMKQHDYRAHIRDGVTGYVCRDLNELAVRAQGLIDDYDLAVRMSHRTKALAHWRFGRDAIMAEWQRAIERAQHLWERGK